MDKAVALAVIVSGVVLYSAGWFFIGLAVGNRPRYKRGRHKSKKGRHAK